MIQSMTGFGKAEENVGSKKFNIEIRAVNSKSFDLNVRMPSIYKEKEMKLRSLLSKQLVRGKIDLSIYFDSNGAELKNSLNPVAVETYYNQLKAVATQLNQPTDNLLQSVLRMPDVLSPEKKELDEDEWKGVERLVSIAIENIKGFRKQEGDILSADFTKRIRIIEGLVEQVAPFEEARRTETREKIMSHLQEYTGSEQIDGNRFEQELIYYLEKLDITEERVRLENHLKYFIETLEQGESQGKKLGFICQEIGREVNTMGSKANHSEIQKIVVQMKDELEKIKEQVLNAL